MSYCIRGNRKRGAEVIAVLESKGGVNKYNCTGALKDNLYFINKEGIISTCDVSVANIVYALCEELTLPEKKWIPKRGETVLVRIDKACKWREAVFSFYEEDNQMYDVVGGIAYKCCIPFDENKLGKVTKE